MPARGHAADEHAGVLCVRLHPQAIAEDGAAGERAGGVHGNDADGFVGLARFGGEAIDQRAFTGARRASDADEIGVSGMLKDVAHQRGRGGRLVFDERNRASHRPQVARPHALGQ
jgi:hypothetical protein